MDISNAKFWTGNNSASNTSWNTDANWSPFGVPTATDTVYIDNSQGVLTTSSFTINIDVADTARVASLVVQRTTPYTINLNVLNKNLKISKGLSNGIGCTINGGSGSILVGGSWSNSGTFTAGTEWYANVTSGQGVPQNVLIGNGVNTTVSFGTAAQFRQAGQAVPSIC